MPVQPIRLFGDPVLRKPALEVVDFDKELRRLVADGVKVNVTALMTARVAAAVRKAQRVRTSSGAAATATITAKAAMIGQPAASNSEAVLVCTVPVVPDTVTTRLGIKGASAT